MPLDINDVVTEVAQLVRSDVVIRKISMTVALAPGVPGIRGDRIQLHQVVLNMVLNGLAAMGEPTGRERALAIRTARAATRRSWWRSRTRASAWALTTSRKTSSVSA